MSSTVVGEGDESHLTEECLTGVSNFDDFGTASPCLTLNLLNRVFDKCLERVLSRRRCLNGAGYHNICFDGGSHFDSGLEKSENSRFGDDDDRLDAPSDARPRYARYVEARERKRIPCRVSREGD